jgi:hypothetical protein
LVKICLEDEWCRERNMSREEGSSTWNGTMGMTPCYLSTLSINKKPSICHVWYSFIPLFILPFGKSHQHSWESARIAGDDVGNYKLDNAASGKYLVAILINLNKVLFRGLCLPTVLLRHHIQDRRLLPLRKWCTLCQNLRV